MIVNIRGTNGSGKSTAVKSVMERYDTRTPVQIEGRKQPYYYRLTAPDHRDLIVPGHYNTPCGGCDTITRPEDVFNLVRRFAEEGCDVLFEGIMVMDDVNRTIEINKTHPILVLSLTTPIDVCLASIQDRRNARGDERPLSDKNTRSRAERVKRNNARLKDSGVEVRSVTRETVVPEALKALGWV